MFDNTLAWGLLANDMLQMALQMTFVDLANTVTWVIFAKMNVLSTLPLLHCSLKPCYLT